MYNEFLEKTEYVDYDDPAIKTWLRDLRQSRRMKYHLLGIHIILSEMR